MTDGTMTGSLISNFPRRAGLALALAGLLAGCGAIGGKHHLTTPTIGNRIPVLSHITNDVTPAPSLANVAVVLPPAQATVDRPTAGGA